MRKVRERSGMSEPSKHAMEAARDPGWDTLLFEVRERIVQSAIDAAVTEAVAANAAQKVVVEQRLIAAYQQAHTLEAERDALKEKVDILAAEVNRRIDEAKSERDAWKAGETQLMQQMDAVQDRLEATRRANGELGIQAVEALCARDRAEAACAQMRTVYDAEKARAEKAEAACRLALDYCYAKPEEPNGRIEFLAETVAPACAEALGIK
jgi:hypothetical protein